jgi:hypothetical protein
MNLILGELFEMQAKQEGLLFAGHTIPKKNAGGYPIR